MAIATANAVYLGTGPSATGQVLAQRGGLADPFARTLAGNVTFTGDASTTSATMNYIDGVQTLPFTPSAIIASRTGGAGTATVGVVSIVDNGNGLSATVQFASAPSAATIKVGFLILK